MHLVRVSVSVRVGVKVGVRVGVRARVGVGVGVRVRSLTWLQRLYVEATVPQPLRRQG